MKTTKMMLEYIASCSKVSLQSFQLARLNDRANLRKQMIEILDELIEVDVQARIAEWVLVQQQKAEQARSKAVRRPPQQVLSGAVLPSASEGPWLSGEGTSQAGAPNDIRSHPVMVVLREALPDSVVRRANPSAPASDSQERQSPPSNVAPASNIAANSRRIA